MATFIVPNNSVNPNVRASSDPYFLNFLRMAAGQGAGFGFGDELEAYVRSAFNNEGEYEDVLKQVRSEIDAFRSENPVLAPIYEIGGGVAGALGGLGLTLRGATTLGGFVGRGAITGGVEGAAFGFGSADPGDVADPISERVGGAIFGGAAGTALGAIGGTAASALSSRVNREALDAARAAQRSGTGLSETEVARLNEAIGEASPPIGDTAVEAMVEGFVEGRVKELDFGVLSRMVRKADLEQIEDADTMQQVLSGIARRMKPMLEAATRRDTPSGTLTDTQIETFARELVEEGMDASRAREIASRRVLPEELSAIRMAAGGSLRHTMHAAHAAAQRGETIEQKARFVESFYETGTLMGAKHGIQSDFGRGLRRARREFNETFGRLDSRTIERLINNDFGLSVDELAKALSALDSPSAVGKFVNQIGRAGKRAKDAAFEIWINSLLAGPRTQVANIVSNGLVSVVVGPSEKLLAGGIDALSVGMQRLAGRNVPRSVYAREGVVELASTIQGFREGIRAGWKAFRTEVPEIGSTKFDQPLGVIPGPVGRTVRIPGRLLLAGDEMFKAVAFRQRVNSLAWREAKRTATSPDDFVKRASKLSQNPTGPMTRAARKFAEEQTFTNELGALGNRILGLRNQSTLARVVVPFFKTPVNLIKFAAKRTVLAPLARSVREDLRFGGEARARALSRIAFGTVVSASMAGLAAEGLVTGAGPSDSNLRRVWWASGRQPYSIRLGNTYYSYGRLEPLGLLMGVVADYHELQAQMSNEEIDTIGTLILGAVSQNLVNKTWLRGPAELIQAISDPQRYGDRYVRNLTATVVPNVVNQFMQAQDPVLREARTVLDGIRSRLPVEKPKLPAMRDIYGKPIAREGGFLNLINPTLFNTFENSPASEELLRLRLGVSKISPTILGVKLSDEQKQRYQVLVGGELETSLNQIVQNPGYRALKDADKKVILQDVMRRARDHARELLIDEDVDLALAIEERADDLQSRRDLKELF